jgi:hypothetical protein
MLSCEGQKVAESERHGAEGPGGGRRPRCMSTCGARTTRWPTRDGGSRKREACRRTWGRARARGEAEQRTAGCFRGSRRAACVRPAAEISLAGQARKGELGSSYRRFDTGLQEASDGPATAAPSPATDSAHDSGAAARSEVESGRDVRPVLLCAEQDGPELIPVVGLSGDSCLLE